MPHPKKLPEDIEILKRLRREGKSLKAIGEMYGVSMTAVQNKLRGQDPAPKKPTYRDVVPWQIDRRFMDVAVMDKIRLIAKQAAGIKLDEGEQRQLDQWLDLLANNQVVLDYHPSAPPNDASALGGLFYRTRVPEDQHFYRDPEINRMLWERKQEEDRRRGVTGCVVEADDTELSRNGHQEQ